MSLVSRRYVSDIGYSPCREQRLADVVAHHSADRVFGVGVKIWTLYMYVFLRLTLQLSQSFPLTSWVLPSSVLLISYAKSLDSSVASTYYAIATSAFSGSLPYSGCQPFGALNLAALF